MSKPVETTVTICIFKRKKYSKQERGIIIGNGELIIDRNFKPVEIGDVWDYNMLPYEGLLPIEL